MAILESYGREVHSIFQLLGEKENDITLSMSWALTKCPEFLKAVVKHMPNPKAETFLTTGIPYMRITIGETAPSRICLQGRST